MQFRKPLAWLLSCVQNIRKTRSQCRWNNLLFLIHSNPILCCLQKFFNFWINLSDWWLDWFIATRVSEWIRVPCWPIWFVICENTRSITDEEVGALNTNSAQVASFPNVFPCCCQYFITFGPIGWNSLSFGKLFFVAITTSLVLATKIRSGNNSKIVKAYLHSPKWANGKAMKFLSSDATLELFVS